MSDTGAGASTQAGRDLTPEQRYWHLWRAGRRPDLAAFLASQPGLTPAEAASVVSVEQYERWLAGERPPAEGYVPLLPAGEGREQAECDVVYGEYLLREQLGEAPALAEYAARFPPLAEALRRQIELHHALSTTEGQRTTDDGYGAAPDDLKEALPEIAGFELIEEVGRGGMGVVYRARQVSLDRAVALKVLRLRGGSEEEAIERMRREAHATARLAHPNIVTIFDAGLSGDYFYLAMEYVAGTDLHRLVESDGPLPPDRAVEYLRQAALGLQHAHEQGLVHRDIKPSNLILTADGRTLKLLDLGLAKPDTAPPHPSRPGPADPLTHLGTFLGTPDFIAPEQANDARSADVRSDLYSLGCTFYYALTGHAPFSGATPLAKLMQHHLEDVPALHGYPEPMARAVRKLMAKRPEDRFQTPAELVAALAVDPDRPVLAVTPKSVSLIRRLTGPGDWVKCVAVAPDGRTVAAGSLDRTLRLWDMFGTELGGTEAHEGPVLCLAFSPDGRRLVTGGQDHALCLWEVSPGGALTRRWRVAGHHDNVNAVCYLPGERLLSASHDGTLRLWDAVAGYELASIPAHAGPVWDVAASGDGRLAISGGNDRALRLWDVTEAAALAEWHYGAVVSCVDLSRDGRLALVGGGDGGVSLREVPSGREAGRLSGHDSRVTAAALSPDGRLALTGGRDQRVKLSAVSGEPLASLTDHTWWVTAVAWGPGGGFATGSGDRTVGLWRASP